MFVTLVLLCPAFLVGYGIVRADTHLAEKFAETLSLLQIGFVIICLASKATARSSSLIGRVTFIILWGGLCNATAVVVWLCLLNTFITVQ